MCGGHPHYRFYGGHCMFSSITLRRLFVIYRGAIRFAMRRRRQRDTPLNSAAFSFFFELKNVKKTFFCLILSTFRTTFCVYFGNEDRPILKLEEDLVEPEKDDDHPSSPGVTTRSFVSQTLPVFFILRSHRCLPGDHVRWTSYPAEVRSGVESAPAAPLI